MTKTTRARCMTKPDRGAEGLLFPTSNWRLAADHKVLNNESKVKISTSKCFDPTSILHQVGEKLSGEQTRIHKRDIFLEFNKACEELAYTQRLLHLIALR